MKDTRKRSKADDIHRIEALRARAARTRYPAEAEACLKKAEQIEARLASESQSASTREAPSETAESPDSIVTRNFGDLDLADQMLLGSACSAHGVRAVRGDFPDPRGFSLRQIRLFGRARDIEAALVVRDELIRHREAGVAEARRTLPVLHRTDANADLFRLAYAKQVRQTVGPARAGAVVSTHSVKASDSFVDASVRVSRPTTPPRLRRLVATEGTSAWAAGDAWARAHQHAGADAVGLTALTTA